jgi:hypothetical protein
MKRFMMAIALACVLSGTALAGDMPAVGPAPAGTASAGEMPGVLPAPAGTALPGDMPGVGSAPMSSGTQSSVAVTVLLTIISLVVR